MARGVARACPRAYPLAKAMKELSKRGMHKPPLTVLSDKHRQVLSLLVHGVDHADANRPDVAVGRPLSAPEIAETLGCRRSYVRDLLSDPLFKTEMAKAIGERLTMNVTKVIKHYGNFIVTANVDGNYDKRGLPDPLVLAFYFTVQSDLIVQLIILRNRFDI